MNDPQTQTPNEGLSGMATRALAREEPLSQLDQPPTSMMKNVVRQRLEIYKVSDLETQCDDEGGSLRGRVTLAYQLTLRTRQVLAPIKPLTSYLVDLEMTSTRYNVAD